MLETNTEQTWAFVITEGGKLTSQIRHCSSFPLWITKYHKFSSLKQHLLFLFLLGGESRPGLTEFSAQGLLRWQSWFWPHCSSYWAQGALPRSFECWQNSVPCGGMIEAVSLEASPLHRQFTAWLFAFFLEASRIASLIFHLLLKFLSLCQVHPRGRQFWWTRSQLISN